MGGVGQVLCSGVKADGECVGWWGEDRATTKSSVLEELS